jgi:hypothetical protein
LKLRGQVSHIVRSGSLEVKDLVGLTFDEGDRVSVDTQVLDFKVELDLNLLRIFHSLAAIHKALSILCNHLLP